MATTANEETEPILSRASKLLLGIPNRTKAIEEIKRKYGREDPEIQEITRTLMEDEVILKEMIEKISEENESRELSEAFYIERIACLEEAIFILDDKIKELQKKVQGLTNDLAETRNDHKRTKSELKELKTALQTGQIAFNFEKDLATYIYPHNKKIGSSKIFTRMKQWLEDKRDTPQGLQANEKWNQLKEEFSWSSDHEKVFFKLLDLRKQFAHPVVDTSAAESEIPESFTDAEKECIRDLIKIIERVNDLMNE